LPKFDANQLTQINAVLGTAGSAFPSPSLFREDAMSHPLVPSDRDEAAMVYGPDGRKIGTIERLMLEKSSGTVAYAVVKCGGVLKGHIHHYPLPWGSLKYNATRDAYETDVNLEQLHSGPSELDGEAFDWGNRELIYPQYWTL
jgi:hypothetical protein